jgi:hypothetical protein
MPRLARRLGTLCQDTARPRSDPPLDVIAPEISSQNATLRGAVPQLEWRRRPLPLPLHFQNHIFPLPNRLHSFGDARGQRHQERPSVRRQLEDRNPPATHPLLIPHVFVCQNKNLKGFLRQAQQLPIEHTPPTTLLHGRDLVVSKKTLQWPRNILVEKDFHTVDRSNSKNASAS